MLSLTWSEVRARRLARHALLQPLPAARLADVVGAVCGIHAQVAPAAELSLGIRIADGTRRAVQAALWVDRTLVKTYGIRGTLHLFPAAELPLWMAALRHPAGADPRRLERIGVDAARLATLIAAIADALDGHCLTLQQLGEAVVNQVGAWAGEQAGDAWAGGWPRWRMVLGAAAVAGRLCYGPPAGREATFVRPDQWTTGWCDLDPDDALQEVFRRYLHAYGPATVRDFAQWWGVPPASAQPLAQALAAELAEVDVEGTRALLLTKDVPLALAPSEPSVRLLPHFDCYVVGCHPRSQLLPAAWAARMPPRTLAAQVPVLLVDGLVAGVWERRAQGRRVAIRVEPFTPLDRDQHDLLVAEAARVGVILEAEARLSIGAVTVRPHL